MPRGCAPRLRAQGLRYAKQQVDLQLLLPITSLATFNLVASAGQRVTRAQVAHEGLAGRAAQNASTAPHLTR